MSVKTCRPPMLDALTSLRFWAAVGVVFHHLGYGHGIGAPAVTFFFVLSGFILTYSCLPTLSRLDARSFARYALARFARIYPVHVLTFLVAVPVALRHGRHSLGETLANLLLLQSYLPSGHSVFSYNAVSWALSNEMFFYLLLPFVLSFAARTGLPGRRVLLVPAGFLLYGAAVAVALQFKGTMVDYSFTWWLVYIAPYFRAVDFLVGCALGLFFLGMPSRTSPVGFGERMLFTVLEIASVGAAVWSYSTSFWKYDTLSMGLFYVPVFVGLIFVFACQRGYLSAMLARRAFVHLGEISFCVFMIHQLVITYTGWLVFPVINRSPDRRTALLQAAVVAVTIFLSHVLYRSYEEPLRKLIRKRVAAVLP